MWEVQFLLLISTTSANKASDLEIQIKEVGIED
jgi:hypothetical protein